MPRLVAVRIGRLELVGRVDLDVELDRFDRRTAEPHRLAARAAVAARLRPGACGVTVSGLYWNTITLASGLNRSMPTRAPLRRRGDPGNVVIAAVLQAAGVPKARRASRPVPARTRRAMRLRRRRCRWNGHGAAERAACCRRSISAS